MMDSIIEISGLSKHYGKAVVVDNLNLNIKKGEIFGLLGPNGAGKSTTIRMVLGLTEPTNGNIEVCGFSPQRQPLNVKEQVGYLPEEVGFYGNLTGFQNLMFTARLNKIPDSEAKLRIRYLLKMVDLWHEADKKVGVYSRGMKQRLGLADVLIKKPKVVILDEPTLGLDPKGMKELLDKIGDLSTNEGLTVLFSSHHLHQVQHICDRVGIFVKGKLIALGNIQSLSNELFAETPMVIEARIGNGNKSVTKEKLTLLFKGMNEASGIYWEENKCIIECKEDISSKVAKVVVSNNFELTSLHKKEYGLNDIYNKYFEEGGKQ